MGFANESGVIHRKIRLNKGSGGVSARGTQDPTKRVDLDGNYLRHIDCAIPAAALATQGVWNVDTESRLIVSVICLIKYDTSKFLAHLGTRRSTGHADGHLAVSTRVGRLAAGD